MNDVLAKLVNAWPSLPFMALGCVLASMYLAGSGTVWRLDAYMSGESLSLLIAASSMVSGAVMLVSALLGPKMAAFTERSSAPLLSGAVSAAGNVVVILGVLHFGRIGMVDFATMAFFMGGSALIGGGLGLIALKCGQLFGGLEPRRVVLYVGYSQLLVVAIFFIVGGLPEWSIADEGPAVADALALVALPLLAGLLAYASRFLDSSEQEACNLDRPALPRSFWKLVFVVLVLSCILASVYASVVTVSSLSNTLSGSRIVMILRAVLAIALACTAVLTEGRRLNFGKIFSVVMVGSVILAVCLPLVSGPQTVLSQVVSLSGTVFELFLWCLLAFISFQRKVSALVVFGYGFGAYFVGSGIGCIFGLQVLSTLFESAGDVFTYMIMALVVFACTFIVFSEREFDRLFVSPEEGAPTLDELLMRELTFSSPAENESEALGKGRFSQAVDALAEEYQLSSRETDILRCVALGYNNATAAEKLSLAWNTVRTYRRNLYAKMGLHTNQDLILLIEEAMRASERS